MELVPRLNKSSTQTGGAIEIRRLSVDHFPSEWLATATRDFRRRADPRNRDGWSADDLFEILSRMRRLDSDAGWIVYCGPEPVGFMAMIFGASMKLGTCDALVAAFYLDPKAKCGFGVAHKMAAVLRRHARSQGGTRLLAGSQRATARAFKRLGGVPKAVMYEFSLTDDERADWSEGFCHGWPQLSPQ